ncbi:MFS transporter [Ectothiorhodospira mobilis]|uniref:MFS transporter n=1 Tax=Ectothiorhodospira mobilis TaxID=195064 RepID=UPI0019060746|nr:MFS transporter [Ectothiorhodospira mobilis]MBK1691321.1 MFS transporter [Ectothiorhodospira mobilis]
MHKAERREILGWAMYDFASQAYTLLIITVIFGDLFTRVIVGDAANDYRLGNLLWSLSLAASYLLVVLTGPLAGAIMDFSAARKRFLFGSYALSVVSTALLYCVAPGWVWLGVVLIIVSNFAFSMGEAFIASFLPDLGPPEALGRISGFGWAMGYLGGLLATAFALAVLGEVSAENFDRVRWVGPFAALFLLLAALPTFLWLRERGRGRRLGHLRAYVIMGRRRVRRTVKALGHRRDLGVLLLSVFFAMAAIYIIIAFTFIYGAQVIRWDESVRVTMFVIVQITAAAGALGFGHLQDRLGARRIYLATLVLWMLAVGLIFLTPWLGHRLGVEGQHVFLVVGALAGACLGATQSAGRTLVGLMAPAGRVAECFGFWGVSAKAAAILGLVAVGVLQALVGLQLSILLCIVLFALAFWVGLALEDPGPERSVADAP